ncbi:MAG: putative adhesin [Acidimicrobiales bacterium]
MGELATVAFNPEYLLKLASRDERPERNEGVVGMTSYVVAHGWYESDKPEVVVPENMKLSFLADVDLAGLHHIQAAQMIVGGVASATTYEAGKPLPNYEFSPFEDDKVARLYGLNLHDLDLWVIGPVQAFALCTGVAGDCTEDVHVCEDGLLGIAQRQNVNHLHFLTCRVDNIEGHDEWKGDTNLHDGEGGSDPTWNDELLAWTTWFTTLDFDAQRSAWESLEYEDKLARTADAEVEEWSQVYEAVKAHDAGEATFMPYLASLSGPVKERLLREHPEIAATVRASVGPETIAEYTQYADWFLTLPFDEQEPEWQRLEPEVRQTMMLEARMGDWAQAYNGRGLMGFYTPDQFREFCAKLTPGARALLLDDPDARALYETA